MPLILLTPNSAKNENLKKFQITLIYKIEKMNVKMELLGGNLAMY